MKVIHPQKFDGEWLNAFRQGEQEAFRMFYDYTIDKLTNTMQKMVTRRDADTSDSIAEAYYRVYKHRQRFDGMDHACRWLFIICKRLQIDEWRRLKKERELMDSLNWILPQTEERSESAHDDRSLLLKSLIEKLPPRRKEAILCLINGETTLSAAQKTGIARQTAINNRNGAINQLMKAIHGKVIPRAVEFHIYNS